MKKTFEVQFNIRLTLNPFENKKIFSYKISQELMSQYNLFEKNSYIENRIFQTESEIFLISTAKDKLFQLFCEHTKNSSIISKTKQRLQLKQFFSSNSDNISKNDVMVGMAELIEEFSKWLIEFLIRVPGFKKFCLEDLSALINCSIFFLLGLHVNDFIIDGEFYLILGKDPKCFQMSRNRMNLIFGTLKSNLIFDAHKKLQNLNLSCNELSILFPFGILKANRNIY